MAPSSSSSLNTDMLRLRRYLSWAAFSVVISLVLALLLGLIIPGSNVAPPSVGSGLSGLVGVGYAFGFLIARVIAGRGKMQASLIMTAGICTVGPLLSTLTNPATLVISIMYPFLFLMIAVQFVSSQHLRRYSIIVWITMIVMAFVSLYVTVFEPTPAAITYTAILGAIAPTAALVVVLLWAFHRRLNETLDQSRETNSALHHARNTLEDQVLARTAELETTLATLRERNDHQATLLQEINQQRQTIRELSVPVLPINADTLVMPLVGALDSQRLQAIQEIALHEAARTRARHLLLDITGVPVVDTQVAKGLINVVNAARLLGTHVALVGIRPEVAQAVVGLGLHLNEFTTYRDLQSALRHVARF